MTPVGVRLERSSAILFLDAGDEEFEVGDVALVRTAAGLATGRVVLGTRLIVEAALGALPKVVGRARRQDLKGLAVHRAREGAVLEIARERAAALGVAVRLVAADVALDGGRTSLYYEAEEPVDLQSLVRDLALGLGGQVEMRQVDLVRGPPLPGQGRCGRQSCCAGFLDEPGPPGEEAGASGCGRLLCYLLDAPPGRDDRARTRGQAPRAGEGLAMLDGSTGTVLGYRVLEETVVVRAEAGAIVMTQLPEDPSLDAL